MIINFIVEPLYEKTVWYKETYSGMEEKANALKYNLQKCASDALAADVKLLMIIATSPQWVSNVLTQCKAMEITPLVVSCHPLETEENANFVLINHEIATQECLHYFARCGRNRVALFGVNEDSYADNIKTKYFKNEDIYYLKTSLEDCFDSFLKNNTYDAVLCTNYTSAIYFVHRLKEQGMNIPKDLYLVTYGDSVLGNQISPNLTAITLDHKALGLQAVTLYRYLYKNGGSVSVTSQIPCKIIPAASTECKAVKGSTNVPEHQRENHFSNDQNILEIQGLENAFRNADEIDNKILFLLLQKKSVSSIAEQLYISDSAVKYRIKKMLTNGGFCTSKEFLSVCKKYLGDNNEYDFMRKSLF